MSGHSSSYINNTSSSNNRNKRNNSNNNSRSKKSNKNTCTNDNRNIKSKNNSNHSSRHALHALRSQLQQPVSIRPACQTSLSQAGMAGIGDQADQPPPQQLHRKVSEPVPMVMQCPHCWQAFHPSEVRWVAEPSGEAALTAGTLSTQTNSQSPTQRQHPNESASLRKLLENCQQHLQQHQYQQQQQQQQDEQPLIESLVPTLETTCLSQSPPPFRRQEAEAGQKPLQQPQSDPQSPKAVHASLCHLPSAAEVMACEEQTTQFTTTDVTKRYQIMNVSVEQLERIIVDKNDRRIRRISAISGCSVDLRSELPAGPFGVAKNYCLIRGKTLASVDGCHCMLAKQMGWTLSARPCCF